jgi:hypothetical protein
MYAFASVALLVIAVALLVAHFKEIKNTHNS